MKIEVSIGEIVDKLSILSIKKASILDEEKNSNILKEYTYLSDIVFNKLNIDYDDFDELLTINKLLWDIEDKIRVKENNKEFDQEFINTARQVYINNDIRSKIKKEINIKYGSLFVEEKSYQNY